MVRKGKVLLNYVIVAPADAVEEGKRIFASHGPWMQATHPRDGEAALLSYDVAIAPELSNPLDVDSDPTGKTCFILTEVYDSEAGVRNHFSEAGSSWNDFPALAEWLGRCRMYGTPAAPIVNSLW